MTDAIYLPTNKAQMLQAALKIIGDCRASQGTRTAYYKVLAAMIATGSSDGKRSLANLLRSSVDRLAAHLYSPVELNFEMRFQNRYPKSILDRGVEAARVITADWAGSDTDTLFGLGVTEALKFGSCILKQYPGQDESDGIPIHNRALIMPWQFGVYREDEIDLAKQPAMCESVMLTLPEVWKRISHMPDARTLYDQISSKSAKSAGGDNYNSFFHQVLSTSQINTTGVNSGRAQPGGIVDFNSDPGYTMMGPVISGPMVMFHELWVWDGNDYTTVQIIEPDIIIYPRYKKGNLLVSNSDNPSRLHPYTVIRPNEEHGNFWGVSEVADIMEPQQWLTTTAEDAKRLLGLQIDKFLGIMSDGITDEIYTAQKAAGYLNLSAGASVTDLTPKFPPELLPMMQMQMGLIDRISGFDNLMSGRGEPGVRAGIQTEQMTKLASPRLRDRSLITERQCGAAAHLWFEIMQYKDARNYWTDPDDMEGTQFNLHHIPGDGRIAVDSHSSSPIFSTDHQQLVAFGLKAGMVTPASAVKMLPYPDKDMLLAEIKEAAAKKDQLMQQLLQKDPQALERILSKGHGGHR